ncbi:MAG: DMT family transporter [Hyphomicrobium sp.]|jgi:drug/metabolite transporter (DMT)-like permease
MAGAADYQTGIGAAVLAALCWGAATVMSKAALDDVSPVTLLALQLAASVTLLWTVVWWQRLPMGEWSAIWRYARLGLLEPGLTYCLGLVGLSDMTAGGATLIQSSEAIMIVIVSAILFKDRPTRSFVVVLIFALFGLALALGVFSSEVTTGNGVLGISLLYTATATAAVYVVLSSRLAAHTNPILIVAWQQTVALIFAIILLPVELLSPNGLIVPDSYSTWAVVIISGVVQYGIAFSLYMLALSAISANVAGTFLNLIPVFGLLIAFLALGEKLSVLQVAGAIVTSAAIIVLHRFGTKEGDPES